MRVEPNEFFSRRLAGRKQAMHSGVWVQIKRFESRVTHKAASQVKGGSSVIEKKK